MKRYILHITGLLLLAFVVVSCHKEEPEVVEKLVFKSLIPSSSQFTHGSDIQITADATGTNLTYHWVYTGGSITGTGASVTYSSDLPGYFNVICTVRDGAGNVDDRQITIHVQ